MVGVTGAKRVRASVVCDTDGTTGRACVLWVLAGQMTKFNDLLF
jgi:hypothetical protein